MNTDINLLTHADEAVVRQSRKKRVVGFIAAMILVTVGVISIAIFLMIQGLNLDGIRKEQEEVIEKLDRLADRQVDLFIVNNRTENVEKILENRKNITDTVDRIMEKMPEDLLVTEITVDAKSVNISGRSDSLVPIGEAISIMTDMARNKEIIKSLTLAALEIESNRTEKYYYVSLKSDL